MNHSVIPLNLGKHKDSQGHVAPRTAADLAEGDVDPNLAIVINKWPELLVAMQASRVALVRACSEKRN